MTLYAPDSQSFGSWLAAFFDPDTPSASIFINKIGATDTALATVDWVANGGMAVFPLAKGSLRIRKNPIQADPVATPPIQYDDGGSVQGHPKTDFTLPAGEVWFTASDGLHETAPFTLYATHQGKDGSLPPEIVPTTVGPAAITILETQPVGQTFANLTSDGTNVTFSEQADASNKFAVSSTGALSLTASVLAINSPFTLTARAANTAGQKDQVITVTVDPAPPNPVPDIDLTTNAAINAQLAAWAADWAGTIPAGKTISDGRVIRLTAPVASLSFSGYVFPQLVTIVSTGPYGVSGLWPYRPTSGADVAGTLSITNCTRLRCVRISAQKLVSTNNTSCELYRCAIFQPIGSQGLIPTVAGLTFTGNFNKVTDNVFFGFKDQVIYLSGAASNNQIENNVMEYISADGIKVNATTQTGNKFRRNWYPREIVAGATAHSDAFQHQAGAASDVEHWGQVIMPGSKNIMANGGLFHSGGVATDNMLVSNNMVAIDGAWGISPAAGAGIVKTENTVVRLNTGDPGTLQQNWIPSITGPAATSDFNYVTAKYAGAASGQGANGVKTVIGSTEGAVPNWTPHLALFDGVPCTNGYIDRLKPKVGANTHWDFVGPKVGAWQRAREIWIDKKVPGQVGWPLAEIWHRMWDPLNTIGTSFTGTYDSNGDNI